MTEKQSWEERLREKLARLAHDQWSGWIRYMFSKMEQQHSGGWWIPKWAYERWTRQSQMEYEALSEEEKDSDRAEADKFIEVIHAEIEAAEKRGAREVLRYILRPKSGLEDASNADIVFDRATEKYLEINSDAKAAWERSRPMEMPSSRK